MHNNPALFMPIETIAREFHGRMLLSCTAAEAGMESYVGQIQEIRRQLTWFPPGVYVGKSATGRLADRYKAYKDLGHIVVAWDEEGLVILDRARYQKFKVSAQTLTSVDVFFAWGENQRDAIIDKVPAAREKIVISGNPRFDILRAEFRLLFEDEIRAISDRYDPYILVNGTFGRFNHYLGVEGEKDRLCKTGEIRSDQAMRSAVVELSKRLPDHTIVVRTHPSENHQTWKKLANEYPNVVCEFQGSVVPWILSSQMMLHIGCTIGVEGFLLDKTVIAYRPTRSPEQETELPLLVNPQVTEQPARIDMVSGNVQSGEKLSFELSPETEAGVRAYIGSYGKSLASELIEKSLQNFSSNPATSAGSVFTVLLRGAYRIRDIVDYFTARKATGRFQNIGVAPVFGTSISF